ncbi:type II secretion system F family protein [Kineosporia rhizophila]|uniref:type II secretion system F family protein n=1 Tax=Kineosporia TaxID=49184 RepID=UPI001E4E9275|nr:MULTISPECIES: type II secretion system F family protein [Kineosporia]MCE0534826.1 type II secretion system F family protein [Kineosporia rhizophila]GLY19244.1 pilus assembly protein TadB [Kineosporia sp. NBRC 101677]
MSAAGALVGAVAGIGAWLIVLGVPWRRHPTLDQRLAPYLRGARLREEVVVGSSGLREWLRPVLISASAWAARISGGNASVEKRLHRLGSGLSIEQFRAQQVLAGVAGAGLGGSGAALIATGNGLSAVTLIGLVLIGALLGVLGRDQVLDWQVRRREQRILAEFPSVAEILALAVGAGEGPLGALDRVARTCTGDLADEIARTLADARTGRSLTQALNDLASRTAVPSLARFVDGMVVAVERGTPLADVLRAQAQDVRELTRRRLMESGGRREIGAMVPVVFLILPVTVLFALYPGLAVLELTV